MRAWETAVNLVKNVERKIAKFPGARKGGRGLGTAELTDAL